MVCSLSFSRRLRYEIISAYAHEKYPSVWNGQREFRFTLQYYLADGRAFNALAQETLTLHTGQSDL